MVEHHTFTIEADTLEEAEDKAESNDIDGCYCESMNADDTIIEVISVKEKVIE